MLDHWSKKKKDFIADVDKLLDIFCQVLSRRRELEKQNNLRLSDRDYSFYEDQKEKCKQKCLDIVESPDLIFFSQQHKGKKGNPVASSVCFSASDPSTSSSQHHSPFLLETKSVLWDTTNEYEDLTQSEESQQNPKLWLNLACMYERYQVSGRAEAAIANSAFQDAGIITPSDKLFVIDKNKLKRQKIYRQEFRAEDRFFKLINDQSTYVDGRQDATLVNWRK